MPEASKTELTARIAAEVQNSIIQAVLTNERIARRIGISVVDLQVLSILSMSPRHLSAGDISTVSELSTSTTTRVIDRLEGAGLVRRTGDSEDRRKVVVEVLPETASRLAAPLARIHELVGEVNEDFTAEELAAVLRHMEATAAISRRL
jgi:DNA-binding MarR family transcriptional regulator